MEGVGARLGRSSNRYGPTTVFSGPVRRWKKKWLPVAPPSSSAATAVSSNHNFQSLANGSSSASASASAPLNLMLFKWTPVSQSNGEEGKENGTDENSAMEETKRRKFKHVPIAVLEEQKKASEEITDDDDDKPSDADNPHVPTSRHGSLSEKPDINDVPMEETQNPVKNGKASARQDLNMSTLDLSLGLSSHEEGHDSDSRTN